MDTFMDKLAEKLTAQEIIRGNLAADAEEMDTLKEQVKDYQECIDQVKALSELMERKMNNVPEIDENLDRLRRLIDMKFSELPAVIDGKLDRLDRMVENMPAAPVHDDKLDEKIEEIPEKLDEKFQNTRDSVHKECVKVYRNVQAVVVEESAKQIIAQADEMKPVRAEVHKAWMMSGIAMIAAILGLIVQILSALHIF